MGAQPPPPVFDPESIFDTVKKMLGVDVEDDAFDMDIVVHINSALMTLGQLGVGPADGFVIADETSKWSDFLADSIRLEIAKSYIYLKVKMLFDPPASGTVLEAQTRSITEMEWRLNSQVEVDAYVPPVEEGGSDDVDWGD